MHTKRLPYRIRAGSSGFTLLELIIVIALLSILAYILTPHFIRAYWKGQMTGCISNEKNLATALSIYANGQKEFMYPDDLDGLVPGNVKSIPSCPTDESKGGYSYEVSNTAPINFTVSCRGDHSQLNIPAPYPLYTMARGLVEHP